MARVARGVERLRWRGAVGRLRLAFFDDDVGGAGQPSACIGKRHAQPVHHEVDGAAMGAAGEAAVGVGAGAECQAGVMVVVEGAEALVASHAEPEALCHCLYGQLAELLHCFFVHDVK